MTDEWDESQEVRPRSWFIRRWAAPLVLAMSVAASIGAVHLLADGAAATAPSGEQRMPRFVVAVGEIGDAARERGPKPWFQVRAAQAGEARPVDSVAAPRSAGAAQSIIAGPEGTFVLSAFGEKSCTTRFYRFRLAGDGRVKELAPLVREAVPARVAGLAMSPDGARLAYATGPCAQGAQPQSTVTVLDLGSGRRRTWSAAAPSVVGEIVWARDNRTLGYTVGEVRPEVGPGPFRERTVGNVAVLALDTGGQGADLRSGRVLFRQPDDSAAVTTAVMNPDGRAGYGVMKKARPPSTVLFSFSAGKPMKVIQTFETRPNVATAFVFATDDRPRYACLGGVDSFGRVHEGRFADTSGSGPSCSVAYAY
ncbi:hypothetical protein [Actinomadura mexicana]|uniref:WD40-like Beta Propeller Repeat n=1 Tax=Actinomadura mexicana TaxID=134959 RepID=A0A238XJB2_9ACTN|nr:hypothetical protein [Actinomadura mexicana]SNR59017.1 hypothetical protein SAMN06265355_104414 [Actinomadura mexicana]